MYTYLYNGAFIADKTYHSFVSGCTNFHCDGLRLKSFFLFNYEYCIWMHTIVSGLQMAECLLCINIFKSYMLMYSLSIVMV